MIDTRELLEPIIDELKKAGSKITWLKNKKRSYYADTIPRGAFWPYVARVKFAFSISDSTYFIAFHLTLDPNTSIMTLWFQQLERESSPISYPISASAQSENILFLGHIAEPTTDPTIIPVLIRERTIKFLREKKREAQESIIAVNEYIKGLERGAK